MERIKHLGNGGRPPWPWQDPAALIIHWNCLVGVCRRRIGMGAGKGSRTGRAVSISVYSAWAGIIVDCGICGTKRFLFLIYMEILVWHATQCDSVRFYFYYSRIDIQKMWINANAVGWRPQKILVLWSLSVWCTPNQFFMIDIMAVNGCRCRCRTIRSNKCTNWVEWIISICQF